ncbi:MAG TPA: enolase C-terminal domain-like protein [Burkholderiales bacterium]|nr:enolase C-terminal domain-like protein [Burkholderiales bacterium]
MAALAISSIRLARVSIPLTMVHAGSMYVIQKTERTVVEMTLENGAAGLGETWGTPDVYALAQRFAKELLGKDALNRFAFRELLGKSTYDNRFGRNGLATLAGLDLAAWDAVARSLKMPLAELIGARRRESVDVVSTLPAAILPKAGTRKDLTDHLDVPANTKLVVEFALEQARKSGFRSFKLKSAAYSPEWDWKLLNELREALPQARIRFDPNANYGAATATELCRRLDPLGLEFFEDPTGELEGIARLKAAVKTPVATNMWVVKDEHLVPAIRRQAVDVVLGDLFMWGGIDAWRRMARVSHAYGLKPALHSVYETGIATVANLHIACALAEVHYPNDSGLHFLAADVVAEDLPVKNGAMALPAGAGLGVTLDRRKLGKVTLESVEIHV